ncbi:MAG: NnrS family protein, partial [Gammaproteobacteria bacterium]|nr:NnrS family protein [Gammaproteobacteria bacterium]NNL51931.1 NnrS family protein [Woeseiaceae bacterium]
VVVPQFWHGHEMIFGFFTAAIAGFLLTAVPSWTGRSGFAGIPLMLLTLAWLSGRIAFAMAGVLPWSVIVAVELAFLPALMVVLGPSLLRTISRNTPLLFVLFILWIADAVFLFGVWKGDAIMVTAALRGGLGIVLVLVTVIGGRIVPAFTGNALKARGLAVNMRNNRVVEYLVIPAMLAYAISDVVDPFGRYTAVIAALAASLQLWRLSRWHGLKTGTQPIVWILHVAYLWLPVGLFLKAIYVFTGAAWAVHWLHALGAGAAATMILAVMTRASLGHTGRALVVPKAIAVAYGLLVASVAVRVFGSSILPLGYRTTIVVAGALWLVSFGIYVLVYMPILLGPRADGRPG